jgi:hypothetical protein
MITVSSGNSKLDVLVLVSLSDRVVHDGFHKVFLKSSCKGDFIFM